MGTLPLEGMMRNARSARLVDGADAVCNFATSIPVGYAGAVPGAGYSAGRRLAGSGTARACAMQNCPTQSCS